MGNKREHSKGIANSGFTLIEVIVAVGVLAIVATSVLSFFSQSAKYNANARMQQRATLASQTVTEDIMSYADLSEMAYSYQTTNKDNGWAIVNSADPTTCTPLASVLTPSGDTVTSVATSTGALAGGNGMKYYFKRPVVVDGTEFTAMVTVDPTPYSTPAGGGSPGDKLQDANDNIAASSISKVYYNDLNMPELRSIYTDCNIVAVQSDEDETGLNLLANQVGGGASGLATIRSRIPTGRTWREIDITLRYATKEVAGSTEIDDDYVEAKVEFVYRTRNDDGSVIDKTVDVIEDEYAVDDLKNIYIFYQNFCTTYAASDDTKTDQITLMVKNSAKPGDMSSAADLNTKLNKRLSVYLIFTRNAGLSDMDYESYQPMFRFGGVAVASIIARDTDTSKAMIVSNAINGVNLDGTGLVQSERDEDNKTYIQSGGSEKHFTNAHTGVLLAKDQTLVADVKVQIFDKTGETEYQVSDTGKGE